MASLISWFAAQAAALAPSPTMLALAVLLDLVLGDPVYAAHPVRLIGGTLRWLEDRLRATGLQGRTGGVLLFILLAIVFGGAASTVVVLASRAGVAVGVVVHGYVLYSMLALGDLLRHGRQIETALRADDLPGARAAASKLVGRDTGRMDSGACRRAGAESLSESLTDGFISPLFWYAIGGIPGVVIFKVVSTMDSMIGYRTPRYLRFGWCGARLDDFMNFVPARLTWLLIAVVAGVLQGCSGRKALRVGFRQHGVLPGPNSGWSEAAAAGAIQRRLIGPVWRQGALVTDRWIGAVEDPVMETAGDYDRARRVVTATGLVAATLACAALIARGS